MKTENLSFGKVSLAPVEGAEDCIKLVFQIRAGGEIELELPVINKKNLHEMGCFLRGHIKNDHPDPFMIILCNDGTETDHSYSVNFNIASREDKSGFNVELEDSSMYFRFRALKSDLEKLEKILK
jgi:hypothetical protein